jgi:AraC family transcriptional regulator
MLALIAYALPRYGTIRPALKAYHRGLSTVPLRRVLAYIDDCLGQDLGVRDLASVAGLSQYHFAKLFRNSMGRTIHQYVLDRRVDAARRSIDRGNLNLAAVGAEVGFYNPSQFSTAFRRRLGLTPREYRESRHQGKPYSKSLFL